MFLTGAHMFTDGEGARLYDLGGQAAVQSTVKGPISYPGGVLPFNYPPYAAAFLSPLALLSPEVAYYTWLVLQFFLLVVLGISITRQSSAGHGLILVMLLTFAPLIEALLMGQMSILLLLLWWWAFLSWRSGNWLTLGVAVSLAAFKPQMVVLLIAALAAQKMWKALAVAAGVQASLWGVSILAFGPSILLSYIDILKLSGTTTGTLGFYPNAMTNLRGLLTLLGAGSDLGLQLSLVAWLLSIGATFWVWWRAPWPLTTRFGVTAVLAVIFSPHLYIHDATLLMIAPLCLYVAASERPDLLCEISWLLFPFAMLSLSIYLLVLQIVPSYTPLILATLLCGALMLTLLIRTAVGTRVNVSAPLAVTGAPGQ